MSGPGHTEAAHRRRRSLAGLAFADVGRLEPLGALGDVELDPLTLLEGAEPVHVDRGVVDEDVLATLLRDEAVTLRVVEPLHASDRHRRRSFWRFSPGRPPALGCRGARTLGS